MADSTANEANGSLIKYFLMPDDVDAEYRVEGDQTLLLLRAKTDLFLAPNTTEVIPVSPVSSMLSISPADFDPAKHRVTIAFLAMLVFVLLYSIMLVVIKCIHICCPRTLECRRRVPRRRTRNVALITRMAERKKTSDTLQTLCKRSIIVHTKKPVKRNIRRLTLPSAIKNELVATRLNEQHPLALPVVHRSA